jgi:hypothetical protein
VKRILLIGGGVVILALIGFFASRNYFLRQPKQTSSPIQSSSPTVSWQLREGNIWKATGTPPACPDPLVIATPVDVSKVTAILYPGQPREDAFKAHGAFRFSSQTDNSAVVKVPMDAELVRGSRAFREGENQYSFEFIAPCGIWYSVGHLLELDPKFLAIANKLPLIEGFQKQQIYDVDPPVSVKQGEVIATAVGYAKTHNVVVDFGVLDLRHKNGVTLRPEWSKYQNELDEYGVCWLDLLSTEDRDHLRSLFGSGDSVTGTKSDYCHYPENK